MSFRIKQNGKIREVGKAHPPLVIVELSGNHNGSLEKMLSLVDSAAEQGAEIIKLQTYTAETMTLNLRMGEFFISEENSLWKGHSLYELYEKAATPWEWHSAIFERAKAKGLMCFSTPFDVTAVDFLNQLDVPCFKIASFELTDLELINAASKTKKPLIISTGMGSVQEIADAVETARKHGAQEICLLKCTSSYPADPKDSNLRALEVLAKCFDCEVGLSDHTLGIGTAIASVALGACVIEKHFNLSRDDGAVDAQFSAEPAELKNLLTETQTAWKALQGCRIGPTESEKASMQFRRSLYFVRDIAAGEVIGPEDVRAIRPGYGLAPKYKSSFVGKRAAKSISVGTPVQWDWLA